MHFFFYGTLMEGSGNAVARAMHRKLHGLGAAASRGRFYAIRDPHGWYPALLPGAGVVQGAIYRALPNFSHADLQRMGAYEDCDPAHVGGSLYRRVSMPVRLGDGSPVTAMSYIYNRPIRTSDLRVPTGDFASWLAAGRRKAFGA